MKGRLPQNILETTHFLLHPPPPPSELRSHHRMQAVSKELSVGNRALIRTTLAEHSGKK